MIGLGLLAGAAGTLALDIYTYADILASGRPQSSLPATVVHKLASGAKIAPLAGDDETSANRRTGAGALMGYGVGVGAGVAYAVLRPAFRSWLPWPVAGLILGASTLVTSEGTANLVRATDSSTWTPSEWGADVVPRAVYGLVTAYLVERLAHGAPDLDAAIGLPAIDAPGALGAQPQAEPDAFETPVLPGRDLTVAPLDPVAIEADREVNPQIS